MTGPQTDVTNSVDALADLVELLGPWRHDIDLGPFSTFDVAEAKGPYHELGHPEPRWAAVREYLPDDGETAVDLGCSAGGISFLLEAEGWAVTGVDASDDELAQATLCKFVRDSTVEFVQADVRDYLADAAPDLVVACGILYHMGSDLGDRNTPAEQDFLDQLIASGAERVLIETNTTPWLDDYLQSSAAAVRTSLTHHHTRDGVRQFAVFDPPDQ